MAAYASGSAPASSSAPAPRDASDMRALLKSMGVERYEPRVLHQLLEYMSQYSAEVFADSAHYAEHAGRPGQLEAEDVQLSARLKAAAAAEARAPQLMDWMAKARNHEKLVAPAKAYIELPSRHLCLVQENYQVCPAVRPEVAPQPEAAHSTGLPPQPPAPAPARANQIEIRLGGADGPTPMDMQ